MYSLLINLAQAQGIEGLLGLKEGAEIGDILASIYYFLLGFIGISALVMMVIGGITYMTAGDSVERTRRATSFMKNAALGLALALTSYLILNTINPDLTARLNLVLPDIKKAKLQQPTEPTPQNTCPQDRKLINGKCYAFLTDRPCNPPEFYVDVGGGCSLRREFGQ